MKEDQRQNIIFRRIRGRLVPIKRKASKRMKNKLTGRQKDVIAGSATIAGVAGVTVASDVIGSARLLTQGAAMKAQSKAVGEALIKGGRGLAKAAKRTSFIKSKILGPHTAVVGLGYGFGELYQGLTGRQSDLEAHGIGGAIAGYTVYKGGKIRKSPKYIKKTLDVGGKVAYRTTVIQSSAKYAKFKKVLKAFL